MTWQSAVNGLATRSRLSLFKENGATGRCLISSLKSRSLQARDERNLVHCTDRLPRDIVKWMKAKASELKTDKAEIHRQLLALGRRTVRIRPRRPREKRSCRT